MVGSCHLKENTSTSTSLKDHQRLKTWEKPGENDKQYIEPHIKLLHQKIQAQFENNFKILLKTFVLLTWMNGPIWNYFCILASVMRNDVLTLIIILFSGNTSNMAFHNRFHHFSHLEWHCQVFILGWGSSFSSYYCHCHFRHDILTLIIIPFTGKTFTGGFSFGMNL